MARGPDLPAKLGRIVRERRGSLGLTQAALAERSCVSTEMVSRIERSKCLPSVTTLVAFAHALGCTPNDLLGFRNNRTQGRELESCSPSSASYPQPVAGTSGASPRPWPATSVAEPRAPTRMRIVSFNVNGLRAIANKGFARWLGRSGADVIGVQETRCLPEQVPAPLQAPRGFHAHFVAAERRGYSGVGLYSRYPLDEVRTSLGVGTMDREGRVQIARIGALTLVNAYFPNGNGKARDNSRVPFKLRFYRRLYRVLDEAKTSGAAILVMGDFNTAPDPIDLARPRQNEKTSGFLPEERAEIGRWRRGGWVDTFRHFEPGPHHYTWWSQRRGVREKNIGWRIDLALASPGAVPYLRGATIHPEVEGSDHCPIAVDFDDSIRD